MRFAYAAAFAVFAFVASASLAEAAGPTTAAAAAALTPYTAFSWSHVDHTLKHLSAMPNISPITSSPGAAAQAMFRLPPGKRVGLGFNATTPLWGVDMITLPNGTKTQSPWLTKGAAAYAKRWAIWKAWYTAEGGPPVDFLAIDDEFSFFDPFNSADDLKRGAIQADPRFPKATVTDGGWYQPKMNAWLASQKNAALRAGQSAFPKSSNYGDILAPFTSVGVLNYNGWRDFGTSLSGSHQSPPVYGMVGQLGAPFNRNDGSNPDFSKPMPSVILAANTMRLCAASGAPSIPWVASESFTTLGGCPVPVGKTPWHAEMIIQAMLSGGCTNLLYFNAGGLASDDLELETILADVAARCDNAASLKPLSTAQVRLNEPVLVSGVTSGSHRVCRVSVGTANDVARSVDVNLPGESAKTSVSIPAGAVGVWVVK